MTRSVTAGSSAPGSAFARESAEDLRRALVDEVRRLAADLSHEPVPHDAGVAFTRAKVEPMVRGLFPRAEQEVVLATLEQSVVYVTSETIEPLITGHSWNHSAWTLANLYLGSVDAELLAVDAQRLVGLSESTSCYVSPDYFADDDPFADFIVHEAAHVFHNCKRQKIGLRETRTREWLLDIEFGKRETFAYSCEAYACVLARVKSAADRRALAGEYRRDLRIAEQSVDSAEVASIVTEAAGVRNGWKVILARCAPTKTRRSA